MNELTKFNNLSGSITSYPIVIVTNDKSNIDAVNNYKSLESILKEAKEYANSIKKPYQNKIKEINDILKDMETVINNQRKEIGNYAIEQQKIIQQNQEVDIDRMKTKTASGSVTTFEYPDATVIDMLVFISACLESGKQSDLMDILQINKSALDKFCSKWKIDSFPGLNIGKIIKTHNR